MSLWEIHSSFVYEITDDSGCRRPIVYKPMGKFKLEMSSCLSKENMVEYICNYLCNELSKQNDILFRNIVRK